MRISLDASLILDFGSTGLCFFILYSFYDCGVSLGSDPVPIISTCRKHVHAGKSSCSRSSYDGNAPRPQNANIKKKKKKEKKEKKNTSNNKNIDTIQVWKNGNLIGLLFIVNCLYGSVVWLTLKYYKSALVINNFRGCDRSSVSQHDIQKILLWYI